MRVLVADDDRVTTAVLARSLERWGLDVIVARDGHEAWAVLQRDSTIALTVLDWMMPGANGPKLCRRIRQDGSHPHMYILLLTARDHPTDLVAGLDAGADDYLTKPFDPEEFRARVQVGLRAFTLQEQLADRVEALQEALSKVKQLRGLIPICSYCKSVRTDKNYWEQVDHYLSEHTDIQFTHGICPTCYPAVLAQLDSMKPMESVPDVAGFPEPPGEHTLPH